jgi:hypothetical protein
METIDVTIKRTSATTVKILLGTTRVAGSMKYPDPHNAHDKIKRAGYLSAVGRDEAVIARPPTGDRQPIWYAFDSNLLRGALRSLPQDEVAQCIKSALTAADNELAAMRAEIAVARATASEGAGDPTEVAARNLLRSLAPETRRRICAEFQEIERAVGVA